MKPYTDLNADAFPKDNGEFPNGMSKLEYYSGLAMQGMVANPTTEYALIPQAAVLMALELIKELNKQGNK